jgi:hypothetical protein
MPGEGRRRIEHQHHQNEAERVAVVRLEDRLARRLRRQQGNAELAAQNPDR